MIGVLIIRYHLKIGIPENDMNIKTMRDLEEILSHITLRKKQSYKHLDVGILVSRNLGQNEFLFFKPI